MSQNNFDMIDAILAKNNIKKEDFLATGQAQALAVQSSKTIAPVILPDSLSIIKCQEDVNDSVVKIVNDPALAITTLFAVANYLSAKVNGSEFRVNDVQDFYDDFNSDESTQRAKSECVVKLLDAAINKQSETMLDEDGLARLQALEDKVGGSLINGMLKDMSNEPFSVILETYAALTNLAIAMTDIYIRCDKQNITGDNLKTALQNMTRVSAMVLYEVTNTFVDPVLEQNMRKYLSENDLEVVKALLQRQLEQEARVTFKDGSPSFLH